MAGLAQVIEVDFQFEMGWRHFMKEEEGIKTKVQQQTEKNLLKIKNALNPKNSGNKFNAIKVYDRKIHVFTFVRSRDGYYWYYNIAKKNGSFPLDDFAKKEKKFFLKKLNQLFKKQTRGRFVPYDHV